MSALHLAAWFDKSGSGVRALVEAGAEINALADERSSPLHFSAAWNLAAVPVLLAANAEVNLLNNINRSPLFYAAFDNQPKCVVYLCKAGADPHLGESPLTSSRVKTEMRDLIESLSNWIDVWKFIWKEHQYHLCVVAIELVFIICISS